MVTKKYQIAKKISLFFSKTLGITKPLPFILLVVGISAATATIIGVTLIRHQPVAETETLADNSIQEPSDNIAETSTPEVSEGQNEPKQDNTTTDNSSNSNSTPSNKGNRQNSTPTNTTPGNSQSNTPTNTTSPPENVPDPTPVQPTLYPASEVSVQMLSPDVFDDPNVDKRWITCRCKASRWGEDRITWEGIVYSGTSCGCNMSKIDGVEPRIRLVYGKLVISKDQVDWEN